MEYNQAQIIREYRFNKNGKPVYKIGGLTNTSYLDVGEAGKIFSFGSPYRRIKQEFNVEDYIVSHWSVIRNSENKKYIIDPYFASRILSFYCHLKKTSYKLLRETLKRIKGWQLLWYINEIKREIFYKENPRGYDSYNVPLYSKEYLNSIQDLLREEFDLESDITLVSSLKRIKLY